MWSDDEKTVFGNLKTYNTFIISWISTVEDMRFEYWAHSFCFSVVFNGKEFINQSAAAAIYNFSYSHWIRQLKLNYI